MTETPKIKTGLPSHKQNALIWLIIALAFLLGARFIISDPRAGTDLHFTLPFVGNVRVFSCPFYTATGLPCPVCGITRASAQAIRGDIPGSFRIHPLGPLLVFAMLLAVPLTVIILLVPGREPPIIISGKKLSIFLIVIILVSWAINLARHFNLTGT